MTIRKMLEGAVRVKDKPPTYLRLSLNSGDALRVQVSSVGDDCVFIEDRTHRNAAIPLSAISMIEEVSEI